MFIYVPLFSLLELGRGGATCPGIHKAGHNAQWYCGRKDPVISILSHVKKSPTINKKTHRKLEVLSNVSSTQSELLEINGHN